MVHEVDRVRLAQKDGIDLFSIVYDATPKQAKQMPGADVMIAHMGCTIGVTQASYTLDEAARGTQMIIDATGRVLQEIIFLGHGGPTCTPSDAAYINEYTGAVGFVGASSLERMGVEESLIQLTQEFKQIPCPAA